MTATELRQAAATLRKRANAASPLPWVTSNLPHVVDMGTGVKDSGPYAVCHDQRDMPFSSDASYIATVHPGVGLALADWLDDAATWMSTPNTVNYDGSAIAIARLINGGA